MQLDSAEIIRSAGFATGHFDVLDEGFARRLNDFTAWLNENGNLSREQVLDARFQVLKLVITRVQLAADRRRIPAIAEERIERPIFVIGYSRTGTTLLHSLLAEDPANRAPTWWHTHQPSPPPGEMAVAQGRLDAAAQELRDWHACTPGMLAMHPYWDIGIEVPIEDEEIHTLDLHNAYPTLLYRIPALGVMSGAADARGAYAFQHAFMQHLQWKLPKRRWAMKGCYHQFNLGALFECFPDALCIWPHRDPVEVTQSTLAISSVLYHATTHGAIDWKAFAQGYVSNTRTAIDQVLADPLVDDPRIVHLRFKDLAKDPVGTLLGIYERSDTPRTAEHERRMREWLANPANRSDRYGRYPYSLAPFGLEKREIATLFADYSARFGLD